MDVKDSRQLSCKFHHIHPPFSGLISIGSLGVNGGNNDLTLKFVLFSVLSAQELVPHLNGHSNENIANIKKVFPM